MRLSSLWITALTLSLVGGCESPAAFPVPPGPPRSIAVDVTLPVYVAGTWAISSFTDALRIELTKYRIDIVDPKAHPLAPAFQIDLGQITYRQWQEIDVSAVGVGQATLLGRVRLADLGMSTVEAAAQPVAVIIARRVWSNPPGSRPSP